MNQETSSKQTTGSRTYRRSVRNVIIHKTMQREFTFVIIMLLMISTLAIAFVIHETIRDAAFGSGFHFGKINPYEVLSEISYQLILKVSCILFVTLIIIGIYGVFFLHRVAGPVYRFRQVLTKLGQGQIPNSVKLREGDFFAETADEFNRFLDRLRNRESRDREIKQKIHEILSAKPAAPIQKSAEDLEKLIEE